MISWVILESNAWSKKCSDPPRLKCSKLPKTWSPKPDCSEKELQSEISRLQNLARLNPAIDQSEIKNLQTHQTELEEALAETRFRLDSLAPWWLWRISLFLHWNMWQEFISLN